MMTRHTRGFTLMELMVVVAILGGMAAILLVGIRALDKAAYSSVDLANQRMLARANVQHSEGNKGILLHPRTEKLDTNITSVWGNVNERYTVPVGDLSLFRDRANRRLWVRAYNDAGHQGLESIDPGQPTAADIERPASLMEGAAWQYTGGDINVYRSPIDPTTRLRSYSLNAFVGVEVSADDFDANNAFNDVFTGQFMKYAVPTPTLNHIRQPANTMCSIAEDDPGHGGGAAPGRNLHGFLVHPNQTPDQLPQYQMWHDIPALWDPTRINISYMDGSTRTHRVTDDDLTKHLTYHRVVYDCGDLRLLQRVLLPGILEYRSADDLP